MFIELIYNTALLVTLSVLYGLLTRFRKGNNILYKILVGFLFGLIAVAGMDMPVHYGPGIIYDGRSIIMVLAGLFGGGTISIISVIISVIFRIYLGGVGTYAGVLTIILCASTGLIFRRLFKNKPEDIHLATLWIIGIIVNVFMLFSQLLLPWPLGIEVIKEIWLPVLVIFPLAVLIIGILLRTEEKRISSLARIKESERLFQTLSENSPVGIFRTNANGETSYINSKWCQLSGMTSEEAIGTGWLEAVHPEDRIRLQDGWKKSVDFQTNSIAEYRFLHKDGRVIWVYGEAVPEFTDDGKIDGYIGTLTDITERKEYVEALSQSEENFRRSMDESPLGVRILDPDGQTIYANQALLDIAGVTNYDEFLKSRFSDFYTPESLSKNRIRREKRLKGEFVHPEYEIEIKNAKGEIRYLQAFRKEIIWNGNSSFQTLYRDITERKKAETALRVSEQSLKEAEQIAKMGSWHYDFRSNESKWSENYYRLLGLQPHEIEPSFEHFKSRIHPEDLDLFINVQREFENKKKPIEIQLRIVSLEGSCKWFISKINPVFENGYLVAVKGIIMDINDIKDAILSLQESEQNYRSLFENHSAIKLMIDPFNGDIIKANKAAANFYGWTVDQMSTMNIRQINILGDKSIEDELKKSSTGDAFTFEYEHKLANGSIRKVEVYSSVIKFLGKECLHAIIHDITQKKKVEDRLKLLSKSIEQSPVSIVITDPSGKIEYVNPKFSINTGYDDSEVLGKKPNILKSDYHPDEFYEHLWKTILSGNDWIGEIMNKKKNGELFWESQIISPILDADGQIVNFVCIKEDITERKRMIREVIEAKEKAEESERLKSAFLANMSHEIRTPLNAILGFTQMLTFEEELTESQKIEYTSIINKSAEGLLQIISDILDISQLETKQLRIFKKQFSIQSKLSEIYAQCKLRMSDDKSKNIDLLLEMPDDVIEIVTDHNRLTQIFMNLLTNAIKFTDDGYIKFGIKSVENDRINFFVSDTGIGIDQSIQENMFERFRQADSSTTRMYGGTGLGLSIVKSLVEIMGGNIRLESELGKGTTFYFYLPVQAD